MSNGFLRGLMIAQGALNSLGSRPVAKTMARVAGKAAAAPCTPCAARANVMQIKQSVQARRGVK